MKGAPLGLISKHWIVMGRPARRKHSSFFVSYEEKKFYKIDPRSPQFCDDNWQPDGHDQLQDGQTAPGVKLATTF